MSKRAGDDETIPSGTTERTSMSKVNIEMDLDQVHDIVVSDLKEHYATLHHEVARWLQQEAEGTLPEWRREDLNYNTRMLNHIEGVLEFYMSEGDLNAFLDQFEDEPETVNETPVVSVTGIVEHEDGSATISFDVSRNVVTLFAKIGLQSVLIEAAERGCQSGNDDVDRRDG